MKSKLSYPFLFLSAVLTASVTLGACAKRPDPAAKKEEEDKKAKEDKAKADAAAKQAAPQGGAKDNGKTKGGIVKIDPAKLFSISDKELIKQADKAIGAEITFGKLLEDLEHASSFADFSGTDVSKAFSEDDLKVSLKEGKGEDALVKIYSKHPLLIWALSSEKEGGKLDSVVARVKASTYLDDSGKACFSALYAKIDDLAGPGDKVISLKEAVLPTVEGKGTADLKKMNAANFKKLCDQLGTLVK